MLSWRKKKACILSDILPVQSHPLTQKKTNAAESNLASENENENEN